MITQGRRSRRHRPYGESERIVGRVVRERVGDDILVATEVPPLNRLWPAPGGVDPAEAFPRAEHGVSVRVAFAGRPDGSRPVRPSPRATSARRRPRRHGRDRAALRPERPGRLDGHPGMRSARNVERNTAPSDGRPLTDGEPATLARHRWQRNFHG
jgi:hypothetical protein